MKSSYWFLRGKSSSNKHSKSVHLSSKDAELQDKISEQKQKLSIINDISMQQILAKKLDGLNHLMNEIQKIKEFYEILTTDIAFDYYETTDIRCYKHNSAIIIYCQTDKKLLCSNCLFDGTLEHKKHNLLEIVRLSKTLEIDVKKFQKITKQNDAYLNDQKILWNQMLLNLEKSHINGILNLEKEHQRLSAMLATKFMESKNSIDNFYQQKRLLIQNAVRIISKYSKFVYYEHSQEAIRHIFYENLISLQRKIEQTLPNQKVGSNLVDNFDRNAKTQVKRFKNQHRN